ncbi:cellulose synthase-like protein E1 [Senna tora]|uniref:Cellulose synthase-like protein E1 n=1 Tax=Senna tora TaxID=362788 RepID=A0A834T6K3_9FABA|nr:cellulose synthase-like protein E1 [Senna tora]
MDQQKGHQIAFVQFPQNFVGVTNNDLYGSSLRIISDLELHGIDGHGGPLYIGTGCFHRREALCGRKLNDDKHKSSEITEETILEDNLHQLQQKSKPLADCTYDQINTLWGKQMGLLYGCAVEDVITGLCIQCRGWKSVYYNPERKAFLGFAPTTLPQTLIQHKRWSQGGFQVLLSKYSPAFYAYGKIGLGHQMGYCYYNLWALNCFATLYYSLIPSLYLLKGISLFPQV